MVHFRRLFCLLVVFMLIGQPLTVLGNGGKATEKRMTSAMKSDSSPKKEISDKKGKLNITQDDFPLKNPGQFAGSLVDSLGTTHDHYFESVSDYSDTRMSIDLLYQSSQAYYKDSIISLEFYNQELDYLGSTNFNLYGYTNVRMSSYINKSSYADEPYIYIRLGVSESTYDEYYSDVFLFKVENPFYTKPNPPSGAKKYAIISNESVQSGLTQYTGQFSINNDQYSYHKNLTLDAYKLDVKKPFNVKENRSKKLSNYKNRRAVYQVGQTKPFWVTNIATNNDYQINAKLKYSGSKTNVWVHNNQFSLQDAEKLGKEFDNKIHPTVTSHFAKESDVDGDGKINILAYDIQDGFNGSGGYIAGYFYPGDLFNVSHSNQSEIFYIDTYPLMGTGSAKDVTAAYETLAHEFQHMVNFNQNVFNEGDPEGMDVWLDEALAMAAEQIYTGKALTDRIDYYNYSSSIASGHSLLYWDYYGDTLANYSLSYLFAQYVKLQSNKGNAIFKEILTDSSNDYKAIEQVAKKYVDPSLSFGKLMTNFRAALLLKKESGLHGFKGDKAFNALQPRLYNGSSANLRGGGAVAKQVSDLTIPVNKGSDVTYTFFEEDDTVPPAKPTVDPVSDKDTAVTGKAEAGSEIYVKVGTKTIGNATTNGSGTYKATISRQKAGTIITVIAEDASGNKSAETKITVLDKTAPAAPVVDEVKDSAKVVTGKAEIASKVTVKKGSSVLGSATADKYGKFTVTIKATEKAGAVLSVTAADKAGNVSKTTQVTVKDKTPPAAPSVNEVKDTDKKVTGKAEVASKVTVKKGSGVLGTATTDKYGKFTVTLKTTNKAGTVLSVTATDKAGNVSKVTQVKVKAADKTPPRTPTVNQVKDSDKKVTGKAEATSKVTVKKGSTVLGTATADKYGKFTVTIKSAQKAGTKLSITATDKAGNISKAAQVTVKDKTAPRTPTVYQVKDYDKKVTGKAETGSKVVVKKGKSTLGAATTDKYGKYTVKLKSAQKAGTKLTITATDKAGNVSKAAQVTVKDKTAPRAPTVNKVNTRSTKVTGKAEAYSTVYVKAASKVIGSGKATKTGSFSVKIAKQKVGKALYVYVKDKAGNVGKATKATVK